MENQNLAMATAKQAATASLERLTGSIGPGERARLAREHKAFQRKGAVTDPDTLLQLLLFYTHANISLRLTAWFAYVAFRIKICDESLRERFCKCAAWLKALTLAQLAATARLTVPLRTCLRIVDGSVLCRDGAIGTEWRIHVIFEPGASAPTGIEVTDAHGAEGLNQGHIDAHTVVLGDRNYGRYREIKTARERHVDLLARTYLPSQPLRDADGVARDAQWWADAADRGLHDHIVQVTHRADPALPARLIIVPLPPEAAGRARQKVRKAASKKGKAPDALALHLAGYLCLLTTLDAATLSVAEACAVYRIRWQVECFLKRGKSLASLGLIRGKGPLVEAQIWAHLLSLCGLEGQRPAEASVRPSSATPTGRPAALWRWLQCLRLIWLGPLAMLAALGAARVSARDQDNLLRERPRRRGLRALLDGFPFLAPVST